MPGKLALVLSLLALLLFAEVRPAGLTAAAAGASSSSPGDVGWKGGFTTNGPGKTALAVAVDGGKVYMGGYFPGAGNILANNIVQWDGSAWSPLGSGLDGPVYTLAVDGRGHLYAGGGFTQAGGRPARGIARWDGQAWEALGGGIYGANGTSALVLAIAVGASGDVYAGGTFDRAGGLAVQNIARWDGTSWSDLQGGLSHAPFSGYVFSLATDRFGFVYAGGFFDQAGGTLANNIARWDGAEWSALGDGLINQPPHFGTVYALAADGRGNLYAGGQFDTAGGIPALNLARWNGESWAEVGGGIPSPGKNNPVVSAMIADGGAITVIGNFNSAGGNPAGGIARWNGATWDNLQGGFKWEGGFAFPYNMAIDRDGRIFVVGIFKQAGGRCADGVAAWDGSGWSGLGPATGVDDLVTAFIPDRQGGYYAAGRFMCAGGQVVNHIAHWDGAAWAGLAGGLGGGSTAVPSPRALVLGLDGSLYVAGDFSRAGGISVSSLARWTGSQWEAVGDWSSNDIRALAVDSQGRLYAGGYFYIAGSSPPQSSAISRWNGSQWEMFGTGFDNPVQALALDGQDRLVAGGNFTTAGGVSAQGLARWNGQGWEALVPDPVDVPRTLLVAGETIYGGGSTIWKIQGGQYTVLGGGVSIPPGYKAQVNALAMDGQGRLVVGGQFDFAGPVPANAIARWDGQRWAALGSGIADSGVWALSFDAQGRLWVAGEFSLAGDRLSRNLAVWQEPFFAWLPLTNR